MLRHVLLPLFVGLAVVTASPSKVTNSLQSALAENGAANVVVIFTETTSPVLSRIENMRFGSRAAKATFMKEQLQLLRDTTQKNALALLKGRSSKFGSFWISNQLMVQNASPALVQQLAELPEVAQVREEVIAYLDQPIGGEIDEKSVNANEWNIDLIEAEQAWNLPGGNNGAGVVVGTIDTGVRPTHEALRNNFRSDHGWLDPYEDSPVPVDDGGHGTHTMGTIAGSGGIGVAPGAQWISCRGCSTFSCTEYALNTCGEFMVCPTNPDGTGADCSKAPVLVSNSWGGSGGNAFYNPVVTAWRIAGIIPVFSGGNSGPSCSTSGSPGDYANVLNVGSTDNTDTINSFSARGPSRSGGHVKPDISAPGGNVRSSWHTSDTAYNTISGTSMACPHIAGVTALLLSNNKNLDFDQIKTLLGDNAKRTGLGNVAACGGIPNDVFPNNVYGAGRVSALKSLEAAINGKY